MNRSAITYFILLGWIWAAPLLHADTIHVPLDQPTVQAGIDAAANGDVVLVAPGTYVENLDFLGKAVTVRSADGPHATVLDGNRTGSVVVFIQGEDNQSVLDGFTLRNGTGTVDPGGWESGGAIYCQGTTPRIENNIFYSNHATGHGAGVGGYFCGPFITGNTFHENHNGLGDIPGWGGGMGFSTSAPVIEHNHFYDNSASYAGAAVFAKLCYAGYPVIRYNVMHHNHADKRGGAIFISYCENADVANNLIYENEAPAGGGIHYTESIDSDFVNNVLHGNYDPSGNGWGGAVFVNSGSTLTCTNTVFWSNSAPVAPEIYVGDVSKASTVKMMHCNVDGGTSSVFIESGCAIDWGAGNMNADPLFVDPGAGDFHLRHDSPCRDGGISTAVVLPPLDFEGDPRIAGGAPDMGADEFHTHLYFTGETVPGGQMALKLADAPGAGPVLLFAGAGMRETPLTIYFGDWYLEFPILYQVGMGVVPAPGGNLAMPVLLPPNLPVPLEIPLQAFNGEWLTNACLLRISD